MTWKFCGRLNKGVARGLALPWAIFFRAFGPSVRLPEMNDGTHRMKLTILEFSFVVLIGVSGSGESTLAASNDVLKPCIRLLAI